MTSRSTGRAEGLRTCVNGPWSYITIVNLFFVTYFLFTWKKEGEESSAKHSHGNNANRSNFKSNATSHTDDHKLSLGKGFILWELPPHFKMFTSCPLLHLPHIHNVFLHSVFYPWFKVLLGKPTTALANNNSFCLKYNNYFISFTCLTLPALNFSCWRVTEVLLF